MLKSSNPTPPHKRVTMARLPFRFGLSSFSEVFLAYQPDSHFYFQHHPEFVELSKKFTAHNKLNNAGDIGRLWSIMLNVKQALSENIPGDFAELGVWRGNTAAVLAHYAAENQRKVYLFDTFEGFDPKDLTGIDASQKMDFADTSLDMVRSVIGDNSRACEFVKGFFPGTLTEAHGKNQYAIVSIDCDLYEPMKAGLEFFYPRMPKGGLLLLHDYSSGFWPGAKKAVDEFCKANDEYAILMPDKSGSAFIRKSKNTQAAPTFAP